MCWSYRRIWLVRRFFSLNICKNSYLLGRYIVRVHTSSSHIFVSVFITHIQTVICLGLVIGVWLCWSTALMGFVYQINPIIVMQKKGGCKITPIINGMNKFLTHSVPFYTILKGNQLTSITT